MSDWKIVDTEGNSLPCGKLEPFSPFNNQVVVMGYPAYASAGGANYKNPKVLCGHLTSMTSMATATAGFVDWDTQVITVYNRGHFAGKKLGHVEGVCGRCPNQLECLVSG